MKYCPKCNFANPDSSAFCGKDGTPLSTSLQDTNQNKNNKLPLILFGVIGFGVFCFISLMIVAIADSTDGLQSNNAFINNDSSFSVSQSNNAQAVKTLNSANTATVQAKTFSSSRGYTEKEYAIYNEVVSAPSSESESQSLVRIGKKYGVAPKEAKAITRRVMKEIYSGDFSDKEQQIRTALNELVQIKSLVVSGDFVGINYLEEKAAWDDAHVERIVKEGMPKVLAAIFSVPGIERTQIKAFYPATNGGDKSIAGLEVNRPEFNPNKRAEAYSSFWIK